MKKILKYLSTFFGLVIVLFFLLVICALIPRKSIENNIKESVPFYEKKGGINRIYNNQKGSYIHYYADSIVLNIIYHLDNKHPFKSIMEDRYYETLKVDSNNDFIVSVKYNLNANRQYVRYWHGSIIVLKPLLLLFNINQIYFINIILLFSLAVILFLILYKRDKFFSIFYLLSLLMTYFIFVPFCFEYSWTFIIMFTASIISLKLKKKKDLYYLLFITGILTCFFDFLSTEILTLLMPALLYLKFNKDKLNLKDSFKILFKSCIIWLIGYASMFIIKWILAAIILNTNVIPLVKDNLFLRINGLQGAKNHSILYKGAIARNISSIFPFSLIIDEKIINISLLFILVVTLLVLDYKNIKRNWFNIILLILSLIPYLRFLVLANHSYRHAFFTFRDQIITIICYYLIIEDNFNKRLLIFRRKK